jgi:hypothetical protein
MRWFLADYERKFLERDATIEAAEKTKNLAWGQFKESRGRFPSLMTKLLFTQNYFLFSLCRPEQIINLSFVVQVMFPTHNKWYYPIDSMVKYFFISSSRERAPTNFPQRQSEDTISQQFLKEKCSTQGFRRAVTGLSLWAFAADPC